MRLLVCTDLDRTLLPNGSEPESPAARGWFHKLAALEQVTLAYVTGRDRDLVQEAIAEYSLPLPDFVLGDVGSSIYVCKGQDWQPSAAWQTHIAQDWKTHCHADLAALLQGLPDLLLQEECRQKRYKLSYYAPKDVDPEKLLAEINSRLQAVTVEVSLIWSLDEPAGRGLVDILPGRATKRHAIEFLMDNQGYGLDNTVFSGDSGNDLPVLVSPIHAILVNNSATDLRQQAKRLAARAGRGQSLYCARGGFKGMNGNYAAGILEGICYYHPELLKILDSS